jgi:glycosyltransferase involved in cell wall biosynthesis
VRIFVVCGDVGITPDGSKGAAVHLRSVTVALSRAGHRVTLFSSRPGSPETLPGVSLRPFEGRRSIEEATRFLGVPDLVYERYSLGQVEGLAAARDLGAPFAVEVNAPLLMEASRYRPHTVQPHHGTAERRLFREADVVLAVSEPLRRFVADVRGTSQGTFVLHNGCSPELFPSSAPLDGEGEPRLVFLGHPKPWHGAEALPGLLAALDRRGCFPRLLIIGGGSGADAVAAEAARLGVEGRVDITGELPPSGVTRRLLECTVAIAPYPAHPFFYFCPMKIVEAMAAGLPVVATAQGDIPEILGGTGVLVPPGDTEALASAVRVLLQDPQLRRELGSRARARAMSKLTWDRVAARLVAVVTGSTAELEAAG